MTDPTLRGRCHSMALEAAEADATLKAVAGWYHCPIWGQEEHWWCERADGTIVDPTAAQFPSNGSGRYERHDGPAWCLQCGIDFPWEQYMETGRPICSDECYCRMVGVPYTPHPPISGGRP